MSIRDDYETEARFSELEKKIERLEILVEKLIKPNSDKGPIVEKHEPLQMKKFEWANGLGLTTVAEIYLNRKMD